MGREALNLDGKCQLPAQRDMDLTLSQAQEPLVRVSALKIVPSKRRCLVSPTSRVTPTVERLFCKS